jgi:HEAT repeat protein
MMEIDPWLDIELAKLLPKRGDTARPVLSPAAATRLLDVLDRISEGTRLVASLGHLICHTDPVLRSKAALMLGRRVKNLSWTQKYLSDEEARVRANVIEALWYDPSPKRAAIFLKYLDDTSNRVAGNAALGLYLVSPDSGKKAILDLAKHPDPAFRATAAWVIGKSGDAGLVDTLPTLLADPELKVRRAASRVLTRMKTERAEAEVTPPPPLE